MTAGLVHVAFLTALQPHFGSIPRSRAALSFPRAGIPILQGGFGGFGQYINDDMDDWIAEAEAEDAAAGVVLPSELRTKRNKILLKWADFVRTAAAPSDPFDMPLAALRNVSVDFEDGQSDVLHGISWEVCDGQIVGVVGESGCGKSTMLRLLAGEATPSSGERWLSDEAMGTRGVVHVPQGVLAELAVETAPLGEYVRRQMAAVDSDAAVAAWRWIGWQPSDDDDDDEEEDEEDEFEFDDDESWSEFEADEPISAEDAAADAAAAARGRAFFGTGALDRPVRDLSSGQQLRVALSLALASSPRVLLLDEPTNHLDVTGLVWLEGVLLESLAVGAVGAAVCVSHDRAFLETACTHTLDASGGGATMYAGGYNGYLRARRTRAEALEMVEIDDDDAGDEPGGTVGDGTAAAVSAMVQASLDEKKRPSRFRFVSGASSPGRRRAAAAGAPNATAAPMLALCGTDVRAASAAGAADVSGGESGGGSTEAPVILRDVQLDLRRGECVVLVGPNGVGKSSLLRAAAGEAGAIAAGEVARADGADVFVFAQDAAERLTGGVTAAQALRATMQSAAGGAAAGGADGASDAGGGSAEGGGFDDEKMYRVMKQLGLPAAVQHTPLDGLSGGEKARLCLAQMILSRANILLLDEPTNHLDLAARAFLQEAIGYFDGAVLMASHDRHFASNLATRVIALDLPGEGSTLQTEDDDVRGAAEDAEDALVDADAAAAVAAAPRVLTTLPDYGSYLATRPAEASAHGARADADRRRLDVELTGAGAGASEAAGSQKAGKRSVSRKRRAVGAPTVGGGGGGGEATRSPKARPDGTSKATPKKKKKKGEVPFWVGAKKR